jgi:hypothetical protein
VLPFLAFGLLGSWLGLRLEEDRSRRPVFWLGLALFIMGMVLYVYLPDTMLQRAIDLKWYSIMLAQLGLFILLILGALALFDRRRGPAGPAASPAEPAGSPAVPPAGWLFNYFRRFSYAGLTAFFWESILSALVWRLLSGLFPNLQLKIAGALLYGLVLALFWGFLLRFWEKWHYVGSIEHVYGLVVGRLGQVSSKSAKLKSDARPGS